MYHFPYHSVKATGKAIKGQATYRFAKANQQTQALIDGSPGAGQCQHAEWAGGRDTDPRHRIKP